MTRKPPIKCNCWRLVLKIKMTLVEGGEQRQTKAVVVTTKTGKDNWSEGKRKKTNLQKENHDKNWSSMKK